MRKILPNFMVLAALALVQLATAPAYAADYDVGSIHISQPWARATPKGASSGADYMTILDGSGGLVGVFRPDGLVLV